MRSIVRSVFALLLAGSVLSACSGTGGQLPTGSVGAQSQNRTPKDGFGTPTPPPLPATPVVIAGVDVKPTAFPNPTFSLTSSTACFANDGFGSTTGGGDRHEESLRSISDEGGHHHGHGAINTSPVTGTPYTPVRTTQLFFSAFVLTDPCSAPVVGGGGSGHHRGDDAALRAPMDVVQPPPAGGGAFIIATDSANPTVRLNIDGPSQIAGNVYTFPIQRMNGYTFLGGHTYTFALAAPPTPTPSAAPPPESDDGDD